MEILETLWEILVNVIEALLFFYLLLHNLSFSPKQKHFLPVAFLLRITLISFVNFNIHLSSFSLIILLLYDLIFVYICFQGNWSNKLLLGCSYVLIAIVADKITFGIAYFFTSYSLSKLSIPGAVRFQMTLLYLLICCVFIFILSHRKTKKELFLSFRIQFLMLSFIVLGIIISDQLLGVTIDMSSHIVSKNAVLILNISGFFILFIIFSFIIFIERLGYLSKSNLELMKINEQENAERKHYHLIEDYIQTLRYWKHDYQKHLEVMKELSANKNYEKLNSYISQLTEEFTGNIQFVSTGNSILDAIVSSKLITAQKNKIFFTYKIYLSNGLLPLSDIKFASLLSNLLDNSLEACKRIKNTTDAFISLEIKPYHQMLYLKINNSSSGTYSYDSHGNFISSKSSSEHGLGLKRITHLVTEANGFIQYEALDTTFSTIILLPLKNTNGKD